MDSGTVGDILVGLLFPFRVVGNSEILRMGSLAGDGCLNSVGSKGDIKCITEEVMIIRIAMGLCVLLAILVMYTPFKPAFEATVTTLLTTMTFSSAFSQTVFETMPYWILPLGIICGLLLIIGAIRRT